jgi:hypothetical protein
MPKPNTQPQLIVEQGQDLSHIWGHCWGVGEDAQKIHIAFDCGDRGFLILSHEQARDLRETIDCLLGDSTLAA